MRSDRAGSDRGSSSPAGDVPAVSDPLREPEEAADGGERPPLGDRRQARSGQHFREAFQVERVGFREGFVRPGASIGRYRAGIRSGSPGCAGGGARARSLRSRLIRWKHMGSLVSITVLM